MPRSTGYLKGFRKHNGFACLILVLLAAAAVIFTVFSFRRFENEKHVRDEIHPFVSEYADMYRLDKALVYAVIECESGYDIRAVSKAGASGLMQLMPNTFEWVTETQEGELDIFDPETNISAGCKYLRYLIDRFGKLETVLAAYNAGEGNVSEWLEDDRYSSDGITLKVIPYPETAEYVRRVISVYGQNS